MKAAARRTTTQRKPWMLTASYRIDWPDQAERRHNLDEALAKAVKRHPTGTGTSLASKIRDVDWMFKSEGAARRAAIRVKAISRLFRGRSFQVRVY